MLLHALMRSIPLVNSYSTHIIFVSFASTSSAFSKGMNTPEALRFLAEESGNVDASGNFSIQVLRIMRSLNALL